LIVIPKVSGTTGGPRWQWAVAQHEHRAPSGLWWRCETLGEPVYIHKRFHKDVTRADAALTGWRRGLNGRCEEQGQEGESPGNPMSPKHSHVQRLRLFLYRQAARCAKSTGHNSGRAQAVPGA